MCRRRAAVLPASNTLANCCLFIVPGHTTSETFPGSGCWFGHRKGSDGRDLTTKRRSSYVKAIHSIGAERAFARGAARPALTDLCRSRSQRARLSRAAQCACQSGEHPVRDLPSPEQRSGSALAVALSPYRLLVPPGRIAGMRPGEFFDRVQKRQRHIMVDAPASENGRAEHARPPRLAADHPHR